MPKSWKDKEDVDWSSLKALVDSGKISEEEAEKIMLIPSKRMGDLHAGMTKAQQDHGKLQKRVKEYYEPGIGELGRWRKFKEDNKDILGTQEGWNRTVQLVRESQNGDSTVRREPDAARAEADRNIDAVAMKLKHGDIEWEDGKNEILSIVETVQRQGGNMKGMQEKVESSLKTVSDEVSAVRETVNSFQEQADRKIAGSSHMTMQMLKYSQQHPDRDIERIYNHAAENNLTFAQAAGMLHGRDDLEAVIQKRVKDALPDAVSAEIERRQKSGELPTIGGEGSPESIFETTGSMQVFHVDRGDGDGEEGSTKPDKPARNGAEFLQNVAPIVERTYQTGQVPS